MFSRIGGILAQLTLLHPGVRNDLKTGRSVSEVLSRILLFTDTKMVTAVMFITGKSGLASIFCHREEAEALYTCKESIF